MQRAVVDWVIAEEAKRPGDFKDAERRQLQQIRKKLVKSRKPLPPGSSIFPDYEGGGKKTIGHRQAIATQNQAAGDVSPPGGSVDRTARGWRECLEAIPGGA
jgi:hypothetical protein